MSRRAATAIAVLALLLLAPAAALAATPRTSLPDVEDEVMCVECGTPLEVSQSPVANQERALIRREIAQGRTKQQIKDSLVAEYGPAVLADPAGGGINTAVWLVPVILVPLAALGAAFAARRWRRQAGGDAPAAAAAGEPEALDPAESRRLDAELSAFDS
jgi:cytochrome c-type biogenesis protein CcmH